RNDVVDTVGGRAAPWAERVDALVDADKNPHAAGLEPQLARGRLKGILAVITQRRVRNGVGRRNEMIEPFDVEGSNQLVDVLRGGNTDDAAGEVLVNLVDATGHRGTGPWCNFEMGCVGNPCYDRRPISARKEISFLDVG